MSAACHNDTDSRHAASFNNPRYRRVLWVALGVNAMMFVIELAASFGAGSVALLADSIDFAGDAANYGLSLVVLGASVATRAKASLVKAATMAAFGVFVIGQTAWRWWLGAVPEAFTMGAVSVLALAANVGVAWMLYAWREGDSNVRSVWLCSRNDAIGNMAVLVAALLVGTTGSAWPDLVVAVAMAVLALQASVSVWRQARYELRHAAHA